MSLRSRWAMTLALVAAVAIGMSVAAALVFTERQLRQDIDQDLLARVALVPADLRELFRGRRPLGDPQRPGRFDAIVQVVGPDGEIFAFDDAPLLPIDETDLALAGSAGPPALRTVEVLGVPLRMATAHVESPRFAGAVQIAIDITSIDRSLAILRRRLVLVWFGAATLAGLVGWLAARRAVVPIERLTAAAEHVALTEQFDVDLDTTAPAEIGRLANSFSLMLTSLQRSRSQQQRLASDAGHELRTPLTSLRTNLESLRRRGAELTHDQRMELVDAALTEVSELSELSTELVDLASDVARSEETAREVDLLDLVQHVVDRFRRRTGREIVISGGGIGMEVRTQQIERAISNLVDNALKWSPAETGVEVTVGPGTVMVRDHGPGIPEEDLPHVFERFYRSVGARTTPGSGLGLAIVEQIVEGHGGNVVASNHSGGGAVVGFTLPRT